MLLTHENDSRGIMGMFDWWTCIWIGGGLHLRQPWSSIEFSMCPALVSNVLTSVLSLMIYIIIFSLGARHSQHIHERTTFFTQIVFSACTRTGTYESFEVMSKYWFGHPCSGVSITSRVKANRRNVRQVDEVPCKLILVTN